MEFLNEAFEYSIFMGLFICLAHIWFIVWFYTHKILDDDDESEHAKLWGRIYLVVLILAVGSLAGMYFIDS